MLGQSAIYRDKYSNTFIYVPHTIVPSLTLMMVEKAAPEMHWWAEG